MEREDTGPDTGEIELQRILTCLKENGYTFESLDDGIRYGCMIAKFNKVIAYSDADGNYINDRKIDVKIEFDTDFDYTKKKDYNEDGYEYKGFEANKKKGRAFIKKLFGNLSGGGRSGTKKNRKNMYDERRR